MAPPFIMIRVAAVATLMLTVTGCGGGSVGDSLGGDEHTGEEVKGEYTVEGTWSLGSPISADRTVGDVLADAIILKLAEQIPSDTALAKIDGVIRPVIKAQVDARAPAELQPDSALMVALAKTLGAVQVTSELELTDGGLLDDIRGTERITAFGFEHEGETFMVAPGDISAQAGVDLEASWAGMANAQGSALEVDAHPFEIRYGDLVVWVLTNVLEEANAPLATQAVEAVECSSIVEALLGGADELTFEVAGVDYGFGSEALTGYCGTARELLVDRALGLFALDAKVEVGGTVAFLDEDGDGTAERLVSGPDYGGFVGVAPEFIAPRVAVSFEATRVE
jgi:hypothetical protein